MSCYVISKVEYVKAAGFIAGLSMRERAGSSIMYLWNHKTRCLHTPETIYNLFVSMYELNVKAVSESWGESIELDQESYRNEFQTYYEKSKYLEIDKLKASILSFNIFIDSVVYQFDNEVLERDVKTLLYWIEHKLINLLLEYSDDLEVSDNWGEFNITF